MMKTVFAVGAAFAALATTAAHADDAREFSHDGVHYNYTTEQKGKVTVIEGTASGQVPFRLYVAGNRVTGTYNSRNVNFRLADAKGALAQAAAQ
ncbi:MULTISPECIES: hypothetical protein [Novosphingobium]|uniref:Uncharacterized protein n=1 Tax=Novosphingobium pentaromativorans TaxID=205844 RepID=A0A2W5NQ35_9SPHN|nr:MULTISPECIES: hypothetical protein [Novosphingobium]PZQ54568.1 MAG: hypothetical protein DI555_11015 [Novosphingobium pentaromativorans]GFE76163.1 hypothetical protein NTCA1_38120 [Novosphingobium sp. TCA1]